MKNITVQWLGHACYKLTFGDWSCVVDPYENGSVPGIGNLEVSALEVFCSHGHHDHNAAHLVKQVRMFAPAPVITEVETFHDDANGTKRGTNIVRVFEYEGLKLAHFGDLGHILTDEQVQAIGPVDVALIPVGGFYTIAPQQAVTVAQQVAAKVVIPMHYRTADFGFDVIAHIDDFTALCENVVVTGESTIVIDENTPAMTAVLTPYFIER